MKVLDFLWWKTMDYNMDIQHVLLEKEDKSPKLNFRKETLISSHANKPFHQLQRCNL
jgi:hypothetical protein